LTWTYTPGETRTFCGRLVPGLHNLPRKAKPMSPASVVSELRTLAGPGEGQLNRAWALSWRVVRFLERAAETARHARMDAFDPAGPAPLGDPIKVVAAICLRGAIRQPVQGEAAVVGAIGGAVDLARHAADILYREYVAAAEKASAAVLHDPRRLAGLRRTRSVTIVQADEFLAARAGDEAAELAHDAERQRARRARLEEQVEANRKARAERRRAYSEARKPKGAK